MSTLSLFRGIRERIGYVRYKYYVDHCPQKVIDKIWQREYGYKIDWNNPRDINEKIQWLICFGDTSKWPMLANKLEVRKYIEGKGYASYLTNIYGVWKNAKEIDFASLPNPVVLKCNHDCGSSIIIDKNIVFDSSLIVRDLNQHLKQKFGYVCCEPHYNKIPPLVFAEEYIPNNAGYSSSLVDYKIWCFNGKPYCIFTCHNRSKDSLDIALYDLYWRERPETLVYSSHFHNGFGHISRPKDLDLMLKIASDLSQGLPEARIDFFVTEERPIIGEITLTSARGRMPYFSKNFLLELGNQISLPL